MTTDDNKPPWHILRTEPQGELRAYRWLRGHDGDGNRTGPEIACICNIWLPKEKIVRKRKGKREAVELPLFPGYLLLQINVAIANWEAIRSSPGVADFVRCRATLEPWVLTEAEEDTIRKIEAEPRSYRGPKASRFKAGDLIRVLEGLCSGYTGRIDRIDKQGRKFISPVNGVGTVSLEDSVACEVVRC